MSIGIDPRLVRAGYIGKKLKLEMEKRDVTIVYIAEKLGTYHSSLSAILNGKKISSDKQYSNMAKAIGLTETEIKKLFKDADIEEFYYKYGEKVSEKELSYDEVFDIIQEHDDLSEDQIQAVKAFISLQK